MYVPSGYFRCSLIASLLGALLLRVPVPWMLDAAVTEHHPPSDAPRRVIVVPSSWTGSPPVLPLTAALRMCNARNITRTISRSASIAILLSRLVQQVTQSRQVRLRPSAAPTRRSQPTPPTHAAFANCSICWCTSASWPRSNSAPIRANLLVRQRLHWLVRSCLDHHTGDGVCQFGDAVSRHPSIVSRAWTISCDSRVCGVALRCRPDGW